MGVNVGVFDGPMVGVLLGVGEGVGDGVGPAVGTTGTWGGSDMPWLLVDNCQKLSLMRVSCPKTGMVVRMGRKKGVMIGTW